VTLNIWYAVVLMASILSMVVITHFGYRMGVKSQIKLNKLSENDAREFSAKEQLLGYIWRDMGHLELSYIGKLYKLTRAMITGNVAMIRAREESFVKDFEEAYETIKDRDPESKDSIDYIYDFDIPVMLRAWIIMMNLPALESETFRSAGIVPSIYAKYKRDWVRLVMASRLGDVGISYSIDSDTGYDKRVMLSDLSEFTDKRPKVIMGKKRRRKMSQ